MIIHVKSQEQLNAVQNTLPRETKDVIQIEFGTHLRPAYISEGHTTPIRVVGNSCVSASNDYGRWIDINAYDCSYVVAHQYVCVEAHNSSTVIALDNSDVTAYDHAVVSSYGYSYVRAYGNSQVTAYESSTVEAHDQCVATELREPKDV